MKSLKLQRVIYFNVKIIFHSQKISEAYANNHLMTVREANTFGDNRENNSKLKLIPKV